VAGEQPVGRELQRRMKFSEGTTKIFGSQLPAGGFDNIGDEDRPRNIPVERRRLRQIVRQYEKTENRFAAIYKIR
jgi:hypothetical protein